jgi:predicted amidohydrolase YtcJ
VTVRRGEDALAVRGAPAVMVPWNFAPPPQDGPVVLRSTWDYHHALPEFLAWCAAPRETITGKVFTPSERLTLDEAIRAVTIDAAYVIGMETELGSIEAGKLADFAVLDKDPYEEGVKGLRDIKIWGTVFEGKAYPAKRGVPN